MSQYFYLEEGGQQKGPYTEAQLKSLWENGTITLASLIREIRKDGTQQLANSSEFMDILEPDGAGAPPTSRLTYIVLAVILGSLGVHNFYAGKNKEGLLQLIISISSVFVCMGLGAFFIWISAIVEAFIVSTDGHGNSMTW